MTNKIIIDDYKNTIKRLQQECKEKTDNIITLGEQLYSLQSQYNALLKQNKSLQKELRQKDIEIMKLKEHLKMHEFIINKYCNEAPSLAQVINKGIKEIKEVK